MRLRLTGSPALGCFCCLALSILWPAVPARAQTTEGTEKLSRAEQVRRLQARTWEVTAGRVQGTLRLDGRVDDQAWQLVQPVSDFYQRERHEGLPATERTEVRVLYDERHLYISFRCFDSQPDAWKARAIFRDESGGYDDLVAVMIDAYHGHRGAIQFVTNANGLMEDLLQTGENERTRNANFDTVWNAHGSRTADGFDVELAIPFTSLRFEPPGPGEEAVFGIGFKRNIPRKNEEVYWPFVGNDSTWYRPAELGHLRGLRDIRPGRNIEVRPYGLSGASRSFVQGTSDTRREAGLDVKWGVTTGLTADFTVNTDFAQEEVDVQQINFTRFLLFYPEKRQLFLEGQQVFQFGVPREADLVFTRRIGLSSAGEIVPILGGARLSGRQGRTSIGIMSMQTGRHDELPSENFAVIRLRRDVLSRSSVGALFTSQQGGGRFNRVYGADASLFFKRVWFLEGFVARVDHPGRTEGAGAAYGRFSFDTDRVGASYRYLDVGEGFRPGIGFVRRRDSRQHGGELRYSPRPRSDLVRQLHFRTSMSYITDQRNVLETREREVAFTTDFETGDAVTFEYSNQLESTSESFRVGRDALIPAGTYRFDTVSARLDTFRRRHASLNVGFSSGGFWGGERSTLSVRANYRINTHVGVSGSHETNWLDLPGGRYATNLLSARVQLAFRNDTALFSLFQYNQDTRRLSANIRFNWIPKPGTDFFIVYDEVDEQVPALTVRSRSLAVKLNYLFAL